MNFKKIILTIAIIFCSQLTKAQQTTILEEVKVEKIKELIIYDELNITEIAEKMNYSSVSHLSNQFKKITGLPPSHFKKLKDKRRSPIEDIGTSNGIHKNKLFL